jgi:hypothetical protein
MGDVAETGWLIEERAGSRLIYIAIVDGVAAAYNENYDPSAHAIRCGFIKRVTDASDALRFARQQDAEAFILAFRKALLAPVVAEHAWPATPHQEPDDVRPAQ